MPPLAFFGYHKTMSSVGTANSLWGCDGVEDVGEFRLLVTWSLETASSFVLSVRDSEACLRGACPGAEHCCVPSCLTSPNVSISLDVRGAGTWLRLILFLGTSMMFGSTNSLFGRASGRLSSLVPAIGTVAEVLLCSSFNQWRPPNTGDAHTNLRLRWWQHHDFDFRFPGLGQHCYRVVSDLFHPAQ